jgi:hypothetical protein
MLWPRRSPDGTHLLYAWNTGRGGQQVQLYRTRDSLSRALWAGNGKPIGWSRDSRTAYVLHSGTDSDQVLALPVAGGAPQVVATVPPTWEVFELAPDGERLLLNLQGRQADAWLLRLTRR